MRKARRRMAEPHIIVPGAEALVIRSVAGEGTQIEAVIKTREGDLVLRLLAPPRGGLRVYDLRPADQRRHRQTRALQVPFPSQQEDA